MCLVGVHSLVQALVFNLEELPDTLYLPNHNLPINPSDVRFGIVVYTGCCSAMLGWAHAGSI